MKTKIQKNQEAEVKEAIKETEVKNLLGQFTHPDKQREILMEICDLANALDGKLQLIPASKVLGGKTLKLHYKNNAFKSTIKFLAGAVWTKGDGPQTAPTTADPEPDKL